MSYLVLIENIGEDGVPTDQPIVRNVPSETEALAVMRGAALDAHKAKQQMLFSLYDQGKELLISYTSRDRALVNLGAFAP